MISRIQLNQPFDISGKWHLPDSEIVCNGVLTYDEDCLNLKLSSGLSEPMQCAGEIVAKSNGFPLVYGYSSGIGKCTLLKTFVTSEKTHFPSNETTEMELACFYLFSGEFLSAFDKQRFDKMTVTFTHLNEFAGVHGFQVEHVERDGELGGAKINCQIPKKLGLKVGAIGSRVVFDQNIVFSETRSHIAMDIETRVTFEPDQAQDLDWFITKIWRFCYLLTLLTDESPLPTGIQYSIPDNDDRPNGWMVYKNSSVKKSLKPPPFLLFHMGHVINGFGDILETWFSAPDTMVDAFHLFMDAKRNDNDHKSKLLLLAHGLEAISRVKGKTTYMEQPKYDSVVNAINSSIPATVAGSHRDSLKKRIQFGNEFSLRKRLRGLLDELSHETLVHICKVKSNFIDGIVETRNYHSHYTDDLRLKALDGVELAWACDKLQMLFRVLLLKAIGIDETLIRERISTHFRLGQQKLYWQDGAENAC